MNNIEVLIGMGYSALFLLACFVIPIGVTKYVNKRNKKKDSTNSGAKFG